MNTYRKKITICLLFVVAIIVILTFTLRDKPGERFNDLILESQDYQSLMDSRSEATNLFDGILIEDQELFYDRTEDYYMYSLIKDDANSLDPSVKLKSAHPGLKIAFLEKEISQDLISQNGTIDFIVYDRTRYQRSHLKCTTLPVMSIDTTTDIPYTRDNIAMNLALYDNGSNAQTRFTSSNGFIHRRGKSSFFNTKGSYKLELTYSTPNDSNHPNSLSLLGMPSDDDWVLTSMYRDIDRIRDIFCTNLWAESLGTDNEKNLNLGTEYKYVEVFINNRYSGIYALGYKLRSKQVGASDPQGNRILYFKQDQIPFDPYYVSKSGSVNNFTIESGQTDESFSSFLDFLIKTYNSRYNSNDLYNFIDQENIADFFLFINLIQGVDSTFCNQYMLLDKNDDNYKLLFAPWDMDYSFGRGFGYEDISKEAYSLSPEDMYIINFGIIGELIRSDESRFSALIKNKYEKLRSSTWSDEHIDELINTYEDELINSGAFARECDRWQNIDQESQGPGLLRFRSYIHERLKAMDNFVQNPDYSLSEEDEELSFGMAEGYLAARLMFEDTEAIRLLEIKDPQILDYAYYQETMKSLGIPEDMIKVDGSLRDQLCHYGDDAYYWSVPEDTDIIAINGEDAPMCSSDFFKGESVIPLPQGDLSYHSDGNDSEAIYLGDEPLFSLDSTTDDYSLRLIIINPETMTLEDVCQW